MSTDLATIQLRRGTASQFTSANAVYALGEPCFEEDTGKLKFGDGSTTWTSLPYFGLVSPGFSGTPTSTTPNIGDNSNKVATTAFVIANSNSVIENVNTVGVSGAAQTIPDVATATENRITLTANCTFTFPTAVAGKSFLIALVQDATGSRTATWPGTVKWPGGVAPALTTTPTKIDLLTFSCLDGTNWLGALAGANF